MLVVADIPAVVAVAIVAMWIGIVAMVGMLLKVVVPVVAAHTATVVVVLLRWRRWLSLSYCRCASRAACCGASDADCVW